MRLSSTALARNILLSGLILSAHLSFGQVAIGTGQTPPNPDPTAVLLLVGNGSQGLIIPTISGNISSVPGKAGMVAFNAGQVYYHNGSQWNAIGGGGSLQGIQISGNTISLTATSAQASLNVASTAPTTNGQLLVWNGTGWTSTTFANAPTNGQVLTWNSTNNRWEPQAVGAGITLSGDITGPVNATTIPTGAGNRILSALNDAATTSKLLPAQITSGANGQVLTTVGGATTWANPTGGGVASVNVTSPITNSGTASAPIIGFAGWPSNAAGVLTNNGGGTLSWSAPTTSGAAGGDLNGTYPNPTISGSAATGGNIITAINAASGSINGARVNPAFGSQNISGANLSATSTTLNGVNYTWPNTLPVSNRVLQSDPSGNLTWVVGGGSYFAGTGLSLGGNTFSVNTSQNISTLSNLTTNGLIKTTGGTGALSIATAGTDYLTPTGSAAGLTGFPTLNQNTTGNAATATALANGRTISLTGDVTYTSPTFDGTTNVTAASTVARLQGRNLVNTAPTNGQVLKWNSGLSQWEPGPDNVGGGSVPTLANGQILIGDGTNNSAAALSGDATLSGGAITLTNSAATRTNLGLGALATLSTVGSAEITDGNIAGVDLANNITISTTGNISAANLIGNGAGLTNLNAGNISSGILPVANGGTGVNTLPANGRLLIGNGTGFSLAPLSAGAGVSISNGPGTITISAIAAPLSLDGLTDVAVSAPSAGQMLVYNGTSDFQNRSLSGDISAISATGVVTLANLASTRTNLGLGSLATQNANSVAITGGTISGLSAALPIASGGTNLTTTPTNGQVLIGNGTGYSLATLTQGSGVTITNGPGTITIASSPTTASNGLTKTGNDIALGGTLTGATTIANGGFNLGITGTGNVGIGIAAPTSKLHVEAGKLLVNNIASGIEHTNAGVTLLTQVTGSGAFVGTFTNHPLNFYTNNSIGNPSLTITGINTSTIGNLGTFTNLVADLGGANVGSVANTLRFGDDISGEAIGSTRTTGTNIQGLDFYTASTKRMVISNTGQVGIGTSAPLSPLQVGATLSFINDLITPQDAVSRNLYFDGTNFRYLTTNSASALTFGNERLGLFTFPSAAAGSIFSGSPSMRLNLTTVGLGIQVDNPVETFQVNGATYLNPIAAPGTTTHRLYNVGGSLFWNGTNISSGGSGWALGGNAGTVDGAPGTGTNFIGTRDNIPLNFMVNNQRAGRIDQLLGSVFFGYLSGRNSTGQYNTAIGDQALVATTSGQQNTAVGQGALNSNTTGSFNTAMGQAAMIGNTTGSYNTAYGLYALDLNTTASNSTAVGYSALFNSNGANNTAVGSSALSTNTTGTGNTAIGFQADVATNALTNATAIGANAVVSASNSLVLGNGAKVGIGTSSPSFLLEVAGGDASINGVVIGKGGGSPVASIAIGGLTANTTGIDNTAVGYQTLMNNTTGSYNTAIGRTAMQNNTAGGNNVAVGLNALLSNTTGSTNTAIGVGSLTSNIIGVSNTGIGYTALALNNADGNTAVGAGALQGNTSGVYNTAFGSSLQANTTGNVNSAFGLSSLTNNTTGGGNVGYGGSTLYTNTTGSYNTAIGYQADVASGGLQNATAIGYGAVVDLSDKVRIGNSSVLVIQGQVSFTAVSDRRSKTDIKPINEGLDFIEKLKPVSFKMKTDKTNKTNWGFIAQDIEELLGTKNAVLTVGGDSLRSLGLRYSDFVAPLVKAVQEQQQIITEQKKVIDDLKAKEEEGEKKIVQLEANLTRLSASENELLKLKSEIEKIKAALGLNLEAEVKKEKLVVRRKNK